MRLFLSTYIHKIDKKGRVSLPSTYRTIINENNSFELILFKSFKFKAIEGCNYKRIETIAKNIDHLDIFSDDQDDFTTSIFSELKPVNLDTEGRFVIPEDYKDYAKINNEAIFFGQGHSFQIWNPDSAKLRQEESRNRLIKEKKTLRSIINGNTNE